MKRKLEKKIIDLAFDEQTGSVDRELGNEPEAAKTLNAYRQMRDGLKELNDIPPMQMSTERMREAILQRGLKPKRDWSAFNWVLVPLATGVLALTITSALKRSSGSNIGSGVVAMNTPRVEDPLGSMQFATIDSNPFGGIIDLNNPAAMTTEYSFGDGTDMPQPDSTVSTEAAVQPVRTASVTPPRASRYRPTSRHATHTTVPHLAVAENFTPETFGPKFVNASAPALTVERGGDDNQEQPASKIVLVDAVKDNDTGAQRAIEVGSSTNVVVGG